MGARKFYCLTDDDHIVHLGDHETWDEAEVTALGNSVWIFDATTMRQWFTEILRQTPEELARVYVIDEIDDDDGLYVRLRTIGNPDMLFPFEDSGERAAAHLNAQAEAKRRGLT